MTSSEISLLYTRMLMRYARSNTLVKIAPNALVTYYGKWEYIDSSYLWQAELYFCSHNGKLLYAYTPKSHTMYILWAYNKPLSYVEDMRVYAAVINAFTNYLNCNDMHVITYIRLDRG